MRSFIVKTNGGELLLTLNFHQHAKKFQLFLHGVTFDAYDGGIKFYEVDRCKSFIEPTENAIFNEANKLINSHYVWAKKSKEDFRSLLWDLWRECHNDLFDSEDRLLSNKKIPTEFWIL